MTTNKDRANYAAAALAAYCEASHTDSTLPHSDLLTDMLHLIRQRAPEFDPVRLMATVVDSFRYEEVSEAMSNEDLPL